MSSRVLSVFVIPIVGAEGIGNRSQFAREGMCGACSQSNLGSRRKGSFVRGFFTFSLSLFFVFVFAALTKEERRESGVRL